MGNFLAESTAYTISEDIVSDFENMQSFDMEFSTKKNRKVKTLTDCVRYFNDIDNGNDLTGIRFGFSNVAINEELFNRKVRQIALELADAVDKNSVEKVRELKEKYGKDKEFVVAKNFLNKKCKDIWDIFDSKGKILNAPHKAMKILGITNIPSLDFLLGNALRYYEKNETETTSLILSKILKSKNLSYSLNDIHEFLKTMSKKEKIHYNFKTVMYLIEEQNYNNLKLSELGISPSVIKKALKNLSIKVRLKYYFRNILLKNKFLKMYKFLLKWACKKFIVLL